MARKKTVLAIKQHILLSLVLERYDVHVDATVNHEIFDKLHRRSDTQIYKFETYVNIVAISNYPEERANERYHLTIFGGERFPGQYLTKVEDYHVRDDDGTRRYQKVRGVSQPVYDPPDGIGYLDRVRDKNEWAGALWVAHQTLTDMLTLLPHVRPLYLSVHEFKIERRRVIRSLTLQTTDPAEE